ncbi:uncharacterized protein LOC113203974 isoform X1 [Frankliniella occidentalis]|uniref:Uncharacterized protein LOC113203974 isoform X1 n=1 Tax=Frankliniella occidentalis TaxID=133901 RepID=A0A6J1S6A2_FRAOC|nr:uncharacterized protein LOC113203974 isoform X1 [Frankliniella occidentalis]XP_026274741.1 uncharacterized protein LOC113203974 isoform X1 [Frankliniella occidentalis]
MEHQDKLPGRVREQRDTGRSRASNEDPGQFSHGPRMANTYYQGSELNYFKNSHREISLMLTSKVQEIEKRDCELTLCHNQISYLKNEAEKYREKCLNLQELLEKNASSVNSYYRLEERDSFADNKLTVSEDENSNLVKEFSSVCVEVSHSTDISEESFEGSLPTSTSNCFMDTLNYSWQESPSKQQNSSSNKRDIHPKKQQPKRSSEPPNLHGEPLKRETLSRNDRDFGPSRQQLQRPSEEKSSLGGSSAESRSLETTVIKEIKSDLFKMSESHALAHCVGSDFIMSSGIAVEFRKKFRNIPELLDQNKNPGQVAFLKIQNSGQYIYYLVTKLCSTGKPKWEDFEKSVVEWKDLCLQHKIKEIAIPQIGCGRDQLDWKKVSNLLKQQFANTQIEITVCSIEAEGAPPKKWNLSLVHTPKPLSELNPVDCALVFIASKDHFITPTIQRLVAKYGFESDYLSHKQGSGSLYHTVRRSANIFGLVVKDRHNESVSFSAIGKCLQDLKRVVKKSNLWYIGFEAFDDPKVLLATRKVWTLIIDAFFTENIEVHFCWPEEVKEKCWEDRK